MVQLEEKTTAELADLKEKIAHFEAYMEVFSNLAALERQEEERKEVTLYTVHTHARTHTRTHSHMPTYAHTHTHTYTYTSDCVCM